MALHSFFSFNAFELLQKRLHYLNTNVSNNDNNFGSDLKIPAQRAYNVVWYVLAFFVFSNAWELLLKRLHYLNTNMFLMTVISVVIWQYQLSLHILLFDSILPFFVFIKFSLDLTSCSHSYSFDVFIEFQVKGVTTGNKRVMEVRPSLCSIKR